MKRFGTVHSFSRTSGHGLVRPDDADADLRFKSSCGAWDDTNAPKVGQGVSFNLTIKNGRPFAVDVRRTADGPEHKAFSAFRLFAEEPEGTLEQDNWNNEGGHLSAAEGRVVSTPGADQPYKVILEHGERADRERSFATMRESESFIRRNTPKPLARSTLHDRPADILSEDLVTLP